MWFLMEQIRVTLIYLPNAINKTRFLNCPIGVPCLMFSLQRAKFCKAHLLEAWWFSSGYIPNVNEYLENACISVGGFAATIHAYILQGCTFTKNSFHTFIVSRMAQSQLIYWSSLIARLSDDLGTSEVCLVVVQLSAI